jgi:chloride channel 7
MPPTMVRYDGRFADLPCSHGGDQSKYDISIVNNLTHVVRTCNFAETWHCPPGKFNDLSSLLFIPFEETLRKLFMSEKVTDANKTLGEYGVGSLFLFSLLYYFGVLCISGSTMTAGLLIPLITIGAGYGRAFGLLMKMWQPTVSPVAYALAGGVGMFAGVSRMHIALTVLMVETTFDLRFLLPIMLSAWAAKLVGDYFNASLFDVLVKAQGTSLPL